MFRKSWLLTAILAGIVVAGLASPAQAQFRLRLDDGTNDGPGVVITDNGSGDINPLAGAITFSGPVGAFNLNVATGVSKPLIGGANNFAELDLNSINVIFTGGGPGTLRIFLEDTGFTAGAPGPLTVLGSVGGTLTAPAGSTVTFQTWANGGNLVPVYGGNVNPAGALTGTPATIPGGSVAAFPAGGVTSGPGAFAFAGSNGFVAGGSYSLFSQVNINFTGPGLVSFDLNTQVVPAPGGLVLALTALPGFGLAWLRRRLKKA